MKRLRTGTKINGTVTLPGSKSITHRALIAAGLARGRSILENPLICEDTTHTINALRRLGVEVVHEGDRTTVTGNGSLFPQVPGVREIFLGNSGTSYRFLLSMAALGRSDILLTGTHRMNHRPIGDLVRALTQLGADVSFVNQEGYPPVLIRGRGIPGGKVAVPADLSSQYVSSLLLVGPCTGNGVEIEVTGRVVSEPYVDVTLRVMEQFGVVAERPGRAGFRVRGGQRYRSRIFAVEGDVSTASYFWAGAAVTGGNVVTKNLCPGGTRQGDISFLDIMEKMGCDVSKNPDSVTVRGGELSGVEVDMKDLPDMVPTLAAMALFARGRTVIRNVAHLRHKESDRLRSIAQEWRRAGGSVEELPDGLVIEGQASLHGAVLEPHHDHRLAMSLAVLGLRVPGLLLKDEECVAKSFPAFWDAWDRLFP